MAEKDTIFGIDLGTTYSCIAYVEEDAERPTVVPNFEGQLTTPSVVLFEGEESRVVGSEAKSSAVLYSDRVVEMVKRHMGDSVWKFEYNGKEYSPEEISSYILLKVVKDASEHLNRPITDVVITCPAYFGIAQREATARAGEIAGLKVWEIINEPTAAAISYGLQNEQDQVVLVYDLGGGTFDVTMIEIKAGAITVIATDGDHELGGRDWDKAVVAYLAQEWMNETGSSENPTGDAESLQGLWQNAEKAKMTLTGRASTQVAITHAGQRAGVTLTREKFDELTADLLERTIQFTKNLLEKAKARGYSSFDQLLLVGGSSKMPQVKERLMSEFRTEPKIFDPDQAVAKGAAVYGQRLAIGQQIQYKIAERMGADPENVDLETVPEDVMQQAQQEVARESGYRIGFVKKAQETKITNVASHSFGLVVVDDSTQPYTDVIANLVLAQSPLPSVLKKTFPTLVENQATVDLRIMENTSEDEEYRDLNSAIEIGNGELPLPPRLPEHSPIEVTFELNQQGRLHVIGREPRSGNKKEITIQTAEGLSEKDVQEIKQRVSGIRIS